MPVKRFCNIENVKAIYDSLNEISIDKKSSEKRKKKEEVKLIQIAFTNLRGCYSVKSLHQIIK